MKSDDPEIELTDGLKRAMEEGEDEEVQMSSLFEGDYEDEDVPVMVSKEDVVMMAGDVECQGFERPPTPPNRRLLYFFTVFIVFVLLVMLVGVLIVVVGYHFGFRIKGDVYALSSSFSSTTPPPPPPPHLFSSTAAPS